LAQLPLRSARSIAEAAQTNLRALLHEPFALFGHSMGALIAYELGCVLEDRGIVPEVLIVAAKSAPHLPARRARGILPDDELIRELRALDGTPRALLEDRSSLQFYLPLIRSDFAVVDTYVHDRKTRLSCPIACLGGSDDPTTSKESLAAWSVHTAGSFELVMFPGNHFFVREETAAVCRAIVTRLRR
jgi:medium-chain acyl-[acyl-carrier-protein] hydrolase